jgi:hypothetical protein
MSFTRDQGLSVVEREDSRFTRGHLSYQRSQAACVKRRKLQSVPLFVGKIMERKAGIRPAALL